MWEATVMMASYFALVAPGHCPGKGRLPVSTVWAADLWLDNYVSVEDRLFFSLQWLVMLGWKQCLLMLAQGKLLCKLDKSASSEVVQVDTTSLEPAESCNLDGNPIVLFTYCRVTLFMQNMYPLLQKTNISFDQQSHFGQLKHQHNA